MKRIAGWILFLSFAASIFALMLGLIIHNDWLTDNSWYGLLPAASVIVLILLFLFCRWFFKWQRFRCALLALGGLMIFIFLFYVEEDFRGWWAWHSYEKAAEAKGEQFNFMALAPKPVPDNENFAFAPVIASSWEEMVDKNGKRLTSPDTNIVNRLEMSREDYAYYDLSVTNYGNWQKGKLTDLNEWQNYYRRFAAKTNEFQIPLQPQSPAKDVLLALSKYDQTIEAVRKASSLPYSRFPVDYNNERPFNIVLIHLAREKGCIQVLELRSVAELENGQSNEALADVELMFYLINSIRSEPFLISHLVRGAEMSITMQPIWEGLVKHQWSDAQLSELNEKLSQFDFLSDYTLSMHGERAGGIMEIDSLRRHRDYHEIATILGFEADLFFDDAPKKNITPLIVYLMPGGWYYRNELAIARNHEKWLMPLVDAEHQLAFPEIKTDADNYYHHYQKWKPRPWNIFADSLTALSLSGEKMAYAQNSVNMARIACGLERYRLAHGQYPEDLDALAPNFISQIPHDIVGGKPLHYRRTNDGKFLLYSVGWNETDDSGQIGLRDSGSVDISKGDWVWLNL